MTTAALPALAASGLSRMFADGGLFPAIDPDLARVVGWTGVHFLWQGTLIGAVLACLLRRQKTAETRHATSVFAMLFLLASPAVTAFFLGGNHGPSVAHSPSVPQTLVDGLSGAATAAVLPERAGAFGWIAAAWVAGTSIMLLRLLLHLSRALALRAGSSRDAPPGWQAALDLLRIQLGIRRPIRIAVHPRILAPIVVGCLRPMVLVPVSALTGLTPDQLRAVLAHELAHVRRLDPFINAVQALFESLLFFHPVVWWVSRQIRVEREFCCDDAAVMACGDSLVYARALSLLADLGAEEQRLAIASTGGSLMDRIRRIVMCETTPRVASSRPTMVAALGAAALTVAVLTAGVASAGLAPDPCDKVCCKKAGAAGDERIHALLRAMEDIGFDRATRDRVLVELERKDLAYGAALRQYQTASDKRAAEIDRLRADRKALERAAAERLLVTKERATVEKAIAERNDSELNAKQRSLELARAKELLAEIRRKQTVDQTVDQTDDQTVYEAVDQTKAGQLRVAELYRTRLEDAVRQLNADLRDVRGSENRDDKIEALEREIRAREDEIRALKAKLESVHEQGLQQKSRSLLERILEQQRDAELDALKGLSVDSDAAQIQAVKEAYKRLEDARRSQSDADREKAAQDEATRTQVLLLQLKKARAGEDVLSEQRAKLELERARVAELRNVFSAMEEELRSKAAQTPPPEVDENDAKNDADDNEGDDPVMTLSSPVLHVGDELIEYRRKTPRASEGNVREQ